jgi:hypothetical protein
MGAFARLSRRASTTDVILNLQPGFFRDLLELPLDTCGRLPLPPVTRPTDIAVGVRLFGARGLTSDG